MATDWSKFKPIGQPTDGIDWSKFTPLPDFSNVEGGSRSAYVPADVPNPLTVWSGKPETFPEQPSAFGILGDTVKGATNQFVDRTQAAIAGTVAGLAEQGRGLLDTAFVRPLSILSPEAAAPAQAVTGGLESIRDAGENIAQAETLEARAARERALRLGASELGIDVLGAVGDMGLQLGLSAATRSPVVGAGVAGSQVFGNELAGGLLSGENRNQATAGAALRAGAEVGTTIPALGVIGRMFGRGGEDITNKLVNRLEDTRIGRTLLAGGAEGTQEFTAGQLGTGLEYAAGTSEEKPFSDLGESLREGGIGGLVGSLIGATTPGRSRIAPTGNLAYDAGVISIAEKAPSTAPVSTVTAEVETPSQDRTGRITEGLVQQRIRYTPQEAGSILSNRLSALQEASQVGKLTTDEVKALVAEEDDLVGALQEHERGLSIVSSDPKSRLSDDELSFITQRRQEIRKSLETNRAARQYETERTTLEKKVQEAQAADDLIALASDILPPSQAPRQQPTAISSPTPVKVPSEELVTQPTEQPESQVTNQESNIPVTNDFEQLAENPRNIVPGTSIQQSRVPMYEKATDLPKSERQRIANELIESGLEDDTRAYRKRHVELLIEAGVNVPEDQRRPSQIKPIEIGETVRFKQGPKDWVDATVVNASDNRATYTIEFGDGTQRENVPDKSIEHGERNNAIRSPEQPVVERPISAKAAREIIAQIREEGRVGDLARYKEILAGGEIGSSKLPTKDKEAELSEVAPLSVADGVETVTPPPEFEVIDDAPASSREDFMSAIDEQFGDDAEAVKRFVDSGTVKLYGRDSLPANVLGPSVSRVGEVPTVKGWRDPRTGEVGIVWDNLPRSQIRPVIMHEVGSHGGLQQTPEFANYVGDVNRLADSGNRVAKFARDEIARRNTARAEAGKPPLTEQQANNELVAHFIQEMANEIAAPKGAFGRARSTYNNIKARIKQWLRDTFKLDIANLSDKDLYYIAEGLLRKNAAAENVSSQPQQSDEPELSESTRRAPTETDNDTDSQRILRTERGPDSTWAKRRDSVSRLAKGLLSQYGIAGKEVEKIRQHEVRGKINQALYDSGIPVRQLVVEAQNAGVSQRQLLAALRDGDVNSLPESVAIKAQQILNNLQSISMAAFEERLRSLPADQKLTRSEMKAFMRTISTSFQLPEIYKKDVDPGYPTRIIRNYKNGKLNEEEKTVVEQALNDVMSQVMIPYDLSNRVNNGLITQDRLKDMHRRFVGTNIAGKKPEQLVKELNETRRMFLKEVKTEDALAMWTLNSMLGANPPGKSPSSRFLNSRYDLTQGVVPASIRRLWGEVDDVVINVQHAMANMAAEVGQYRTMNALHDRWEKAGKISNAPTDSNTVRLQGKEFGLLNGKFVTPKRAESVQSIVDTYNKSLSVNEAILRGDKEFRNAVLGKASDAVRGVSALYKANAIMGNVANWWFNLVGSPETLVSSGNIPLLNQSKGIQGLARGLQGITGTVVAGTRKDTNPYTSELIRNGITENAQIGEIKNLIDKSAYKRDIIDAMENSKDMVEFKNSLQKVWHKAKKAGRTINSAGQTGLVEAVNFYSLLDLWGPAVTYFKNKDDIQSHWDKTNVKYTESELEQEAAHVTKNSTVVMSYIPQIIRMTEGYGLSYVLPYLYAANRALGYNAVFAYRQIADGIKTGDRDYVIKGTARLVGTSVATATFYARISPLAALGSLPFVLAGNTLTHLLDSDDEEEKAVLDSMKQDDMFKLSNPAVVMKDGDTYWVVDMNRVFVNEPGLETVQVAYNSVIDWLAGDVSSAEAAEEVRKHLADQIFMNASLVRLFKGMINPEYQSVLRRDAREYYDQTIGDNGFAQRLELLGELSLPKIATTLTTELAKDTQGSPTPDTLRRLKSLGFPIYEINPVAEAKGSQFGRGTRIMQSEYSAGKDEFKSSAGLFTQIDENKLRADYIDFARKQLDAYNKALPTIHAALTMGASASDLLDGMKDNNFSLPKNVREAAVDETFELATISDSFFKGELQEAAEMAAKYKNPEEKLSEWEMMFEERLELIRQIRDETQELINEGRFN